MPLDLVVDKIDSVPEALRSAYVEKDGKFHLDVEVEDTAGLKSALKKERDRANALDKDVARWKSLGKSADEIADLVAAKEKEAEEAAKKAGNFDAILKQHQDKAKAELDAANKRLEGANAAARAAIVDASITTALTKSKATPEGIELLAERLGKRVKLEIGDDGKRKISILQADGETPMAGKGADGGATFDDLVAEAMKQYPSLFEGTGSGGGGTPPKGGKPGQKTYTQAEFDALGAKDRARVANEPGFKIEG